MNLGSGAGHHTYRKKEVQAEAAMRWVAFRGDADGAPGVRFLTLNLIAAARVALREARLMAMQGISG